MQSAEATIRLHTYSKNDDIATQQESGVGLSGENMLAHRPAKVRGKPHGYYISSPTQQCCERAGK
jgi:hypothetical protein